MNDTSYWARGLRVSPRGAVIILMLVVAVLLLFIPMASCPMCHGRGGVDPEVNREWMRTHHLMLSGLIYEDLGRATCARCKGSGRVTPLGALTQ